MKKILGKQSVEQILKTISRETGQDYTSRLDADLSINEELDILTKAVDELVDKTLQESLARKEAEQAFFETKEKLGALFRFSPVAILTFNTKGIVTSWNRAAEDLFGWTEEEVLGRFLPTSHENDSQFLEFQDKAFNNGMSCIKAEIPRKRKNGETFIAGITAASFCDSEGHVTGVFSVFEDVTGRKQAEEDRFKAELRFQNLVAESPIGISIHDASGQCIIANDAMAKIFGTTKEHLMTFNYNNLAYWRKSGLLEIAKRVIREQTSAFFMDSGTSFAGKEYSVDSHMVSFEGDNLLYIVQDATDRVKAEKVIKETNRLLLESQRVAKLGHFTVDMANDSWQDSAAVKEIMGIDADYPKTLESWFKMVHPDFLPKIKDFVQQQQRRAKEQLDIEFKIIRPVDGRERWVHAITRFENDHEDNQPRLIGTIQDISERKKLEDQLQQSQKMEAIGQLAGGVAHDFNNMLSVILGYSELMKDRLRPGEQLFRDITEIEKAAIHSRDITRQLLAFSRKQIIAPKKIDLNKLIAGIQKTLAPLIGEDIHLTFIPGKNLGKVRVDPAQINQILVNLVVNARDAMPDGGKLTIETMNVDIDEEYCRLHADCVTGHYVILTIFDNGMGMDRETLTRIFEPFFTTKEVGKGTGLGLATVYGIVRQNGGFINVYSERGQGTLFKLHIPRIMEETEIKEKPAKFEVGAQTGTIILVEDDEMVRSMTEAMLKKLGYAVIAMETPKEALAYFKQKDISVDLLMTDVIMPEIKGTELRDRIKALLPDIKVLFMSGYTSNVIVHQGVLEPGVNFIQKPFSLKDLSEKIRKAMEK